MNDSAPEAPVPPREGRPERGLPADVTEAGVPPGPGPAAPAPLGVERSPTGNAQVDARLERLADTDHLATDGHVEVYEDVHRGLRDELTALDARPEPPAPTRDPAAGPDRDPLGRPTDPSSHDSRS